MSSWILHVPEWVGEHYFEQLTAASRVQIENKRTGRIRYEWMAHQQRNEALDLTVYAHPGLWILQKIIDPVTFDDLSAIVSQVQNGNAPLTLAKAMGSRIISRAQMYTTENKEFVLEKAPPGK